MRDFFINWAEKLVGVLVGLIVIGSIGMGGFMMMMPAMNGGGVLTGLLFIVGGALYAALTAIFEAITAYGGLPRDQG